MSTIGKFLFLPLALVLASCRPEGSDGPPAGPSGPQGGESAGERAACVARGGEYRRGGLAGAWICFERTRDAGKSCRAASDCEGLCLAESRSCAPVRPMFGCHAILDEDGTPVTICID